MYEEFNKPIQELIKLMKLHYPHDYELVLTADGATIRSTQSSMSFMDDSIKQELSEDKKREIQKAKIDRIIAAIYK